jgi:hypothetical protein
MNETDEKKTPSPDQPSAKLSEAAYLEQHASAAKDAIAGAFHDLKEDLARGADPREWMKSHPWMTLASAAIAGFAAAAATIPSKEEQALKKLAAIEKAIHGHRPESANGHEGADEHKKEPGGMMAMVLRELIGAVKPAVISLLTARLNPQGPPPHPQADSPRPSDQDA